MVQVIEINNKTKKNLKHDKYKQLKDVIILFQFLQKHHKIRTHQYTVDNKTQKNQKNKKKNNHKVSEDQNDIEKNKYAIR